MLKETRGQGAREDLIHEAPRRISHKATQKKNNTGTTALDRQLVKKYFNWRQTSKAYKETSEEEKSVVNGHCNHLSLKFSVCVKDQMTKF